MRVGRQAALALGLFTACATAPAPPPPRPVAVASAPVTPAVAEVTEAPASEESFGLPRPDAVACRYAGEHSGRLELRFEAGGPAFAFVVQPRAVVVRVPVGAASGMHVELEAGEVEVSGVLAPEDYQLHPASGQLVAGLLFVEGAAVVTWVDGAAGQLAVDVPVPEQLTLLRGASPRITLACDELDHRPRRYDFEATLGLNPAGESAEIAATTFQIAAQLGVPATGRLDLQGLGAADRQVRVYERANGRARIAWDPPRSATVVFGWVQESLLTPSGSLVGRGYGRGSGRAGPAALRASPLRCDHPVALYARIGEQERRVGRIPAMHALDLSEQAAEGRRAVNLPQVRPVSGAELLVHETDISDCRG